MQSDGLFQCTPTYKVDHSNAMRANNGSKEAGQSDSANVLEKCKDDDVGFSRTYLDDLRIANEFLSHVTEHILLYLVTMRRSLVF